LRSGVKATRRKKNIAKLCGIWQGKGFENITDLEGELKEIRTASPLISPKPSAS
jgi:hypothetical protein